MARSSAACTGSSWSAPFLRSNVGHRALVLVGGEAPGQRSVHLAPERVEVEVEGQRRETLAGDRAHRRERQEPLDRLVERLRKIRGRDRAGQQADKLAPPRGEGAAGADQL